MKVGLGVYSETELMGFLDIADVGCKRRVAFNLERKAM